MDRFDLTAERERLDLAADCERCFGLCCVAPGFKASDAFAFDKLPGKPCRNLLADFGCGIHDNLRQRGLSGCTAYTCYGAGQKIAQGAFGGIDWRQAPETAELMFQVLPIFRQLNELLWFITEALDRCPAGADHRELLDLLDATERLTTIRADEMSWGAVDEHCLGGEELLTRVSARIRATVVANDSLGTAPERVVALLPALRESDLRGADLRDADLRGADLRGADLRGADLRGADLRGADLWGAVLAKADLTGAEMQWADLMGANLGGADLAGADLSGAIFLTQSQLQLATGDRRTALSDSMQTPAHWL